MFIATGCRGMSEANTFLTNALGQKVLVKLKGGRKVRGVLKSFDAHLNLIIVNAEEIEESTAKKMGTLVVRGDNVVMISPI